MNIKSKNFFVNLSGIAFLIMVVILYFLLYLFPALKSINRYKRQLKDMNQKITDFQQVETDFSIPDAQERAYFEQAEQELSRKLPFIRRQEDFISLFTKISDHIKKLARRDGISNLVTVSREDTRSHAKKDGDLSALVKNVKSRVITLSFSGELKNAANFINHIPRCEYYLNEDRIVVSAGDLLPYYIVLLKIYYIDGNATQSQPGQPVSPSTEGDPGKTGAGSGGPIIDYDSEVLLKPLDPAWTVPYPQKELPQKFGISIFTREKPGKSLPPGNQNLKHKKRITRSKRNPRGYLRT